MRSQRAETGKSCLQGTSSGENQVHLFLFGCHCPQPPGNESSLGLSWIICPHPEKERRGLDGQSHVGQMQKEG